MWWISHLRLVEKYPALRDVTCDRSQQSETGGPFNMLYELIPGSVRSDVELGHPHIYRNDIYVKIFDLGHT